MLQRPEKSSVPWEFITTIKLDSVSKSYNGVPAVQDISLTIQGGELLVLMGGSGSGKTTTIRMINRLIEPDNGVIYINDIPVSSLHPLSLRRSIGYVIQQIGLLPHLPVSANIGLPLRISGAQEDEISQKIKNLLSLVRLDPEMFQNRKPAELSGGEQQRVGLARALATNPPLLLMDEPFGALDPLLRRKLQKEFLEIKKNLGITIIFVTHDIHEAFLLGDRIALFHEGRLHTVGTPQDLIGSARSDPVLSYFIGDDHLSYSTSLPAISFALRSGSFILFPLAEYSQINQSDYGTKVILYKGEEGIYHASTPGSMHTLSPVSLVDEDATVQDVVTACTNARSHVAVMHTSVNSQEMSDSQIRIILLDDILQFLFGSPE